MNSLYRPTSRSAATFKAVIALTIGTIGSRAYADSSAAYWFGGTSTNGKWETTADWQLDQPGSVQSIPPADNASLSVRIGNGNDVTATSNFDQTTMNAYVSAGTIASGAALHVGTLLIGDGASAVGTLNISGGTLSVGSFYVGGWHLSDGSNGTLNITGGLIDVTGSLTVGNEDQTTASHGTILMSGGKIDYGSNTVSFGNRESTGAVFLSGGLITGTGLVTIGGSTITSGSTSTSPGVGSLNISNAGQFVAGSITFNTGRPNKTILALNDTLSISGGTLSVGSIGQGVGSTGLNCSVSFTGGTVTANTFRMMLNQQGGTLSPGTGGTLGGGADIGSINLLDDSMSKPAGHANYTQSAGAHLLLDIGNGTNDVVHLENNGTPGVSLTATLNGEIDIHPITGYTPTIGDTFIILTADSISDASNIQSTSDNNFIFTKSQTTGTIPEGNASAAGAILQIRFAGHARPGDATRDQTIDSHDFDVLAAHFGQRGLAWGQGDFNGDGIVNGLDFNALATNFGNGGTSENPIGGAVAEDAFKFESIVPEPTSATILFVTAGFGLRRRIR